MRKIAAIPGMPDKMTVLRWLLVHDAFRSQYARARELQADVLFEDALEIADNGTNDWMSQNDPDNPGYRMNGEHVQRSRLRVDTRKWAASKLAPKKYADKLDIEHSGEGMTLEVIDYRQASPRDYRAGQASPANPA